MARGVLLGKSGGFGGGNGGLVGRAYYLVGSTEVTGLAAVAQRT